jgi:adenylylsulfate kinase
MIQAQRMGALSNILYEQGFNVVADFVCPTKTTRELFGQAKIIWMDTIKESRYQDTNQLFEPPNEYFLRITNFDYDLNLI